VFYDTGEDRNRKGKRKQKREQVLSGDDLTTGTSNIKVHWTQQRHTLVVSYIDHSQHEKKRERKSIKLKWSN